MTRENSLLPYLSILASLAIFSAMDATMKHASIAVGAYSATLLRNAIGFVLFLPLWLHEGARWPERAALIVHVKRGLVGAGTATTFFYALVRLPMAEAIAISFVSPLFALFLAALLLKERITRQATGASLMGVAGVLVIAGARLGEGEMHPEAIRGIAAVLVSAALYAWYLILQRQQAQLASPREVAVFQTGVAGLALSLAAPWMLELPGPAIWGSIAGAAVLGGTALMLASWAYRRAEAQALVPFEYSSFLWAALIGWFAFGEVVTWGTVLGAALIVAACWTAAPKKHIEQTAV